MPRGGFTKPEEIEEAYERIKRKIEEVFGEDPLGYRDVREFEERVIRLFEEGNVPPSWSKAGRFRPTFKLLDALGEQWLSEAEEWARWGIRKVLVRYPWRKEIRYAISGLRGLWGREMAEMIREVSEEMVRYIWERYRTTVIFW